MFLAWAIMNGLQGDMHKEESPDELKAVRERKMTGRDFLFRACDGKFWEDDLSDEGNAFAAAYYLGEGGEGYGPYLEDYEQTLAVGLPTTYHVEDNWRNFDAIAPIISERFVEWQEQKRGQA